VLHEQPALTSNTGVITPSSWIPQKNLLCYRHNNLQIVQLNNLDSAQPENREESGEHGGTPAKTGPVS
jgi:hypothetical protein